MVYHNDYLPQVYIDMHHIWDDNYTNIFEDEVLMGKGSLKRMKIKIM
jgi:hypothetical protein